VLGLECCKRLSLLHTVVQLISLALHCLLLY